MHPDLLIHAEHQRELTEWDRRELALLDGAAGVFEPLRGAIARLGVKAEQETFQRRLREMFESGIAAASPKLKLLCCLEALASAAIAPTTPSIENPDPPAACGVGRAQTLVR